MPPDEPKYLRKLKHEKNEVRFQENLKDFRFK
jgi:hypothetical protein